MFLLECQALTSLVESGYPRWTSEMFSAVPETAHGLYKQDRALMLDFGGLEESSYLFRVRSPVGGNVDESWGDETSHFITSAAAVGHRLRGRIRGRAFDGSEDRSLGL